MKRILFVHHVSVIGGASYCMLNLIKNIDRKYFEPIVLLAGTGPLVSEIEKMGVEILYINGLTSVPYNKSIFAWGAVFSYYQIKTTISNFKQLLKDNNIDIVYLNNVMLYPYLKPAKECGKTTIIHIREHWPENEHKVQLSWLQRSVQKYADFIVAINEYSATLVPKIREKTTIVYDWIDFTDRFEERPMSEVLCEDASSLKVFIFTGGRSGWKGAAEVAETFCRRVENPDCRLLMLGTDGTYPFIGTAGIIKRILSFFGYVPYETRFTKYVNSDNRIKCIPATYKLQHILEQSYAMLSFFTIPHANLAMAEAITLGLPCVAAETEESLEYSRGGVGAKLFKINNMDDFAASIDWLMKNYEFQKSRTESISNYVKIKFNKDRNIEVFNNFLRSIVSDKSN